MLDWWNTEARRQHEATLERVHRQESSIEALRLELVRFTEMQGRCRGQCEGLERGLAEESEARYDAERAQNADMQGLRDHVAAELSRSSTVVREVQDSLAGLKESTTTALTELRRTLQQLGGDGAGTGGLDGAGRGGGTGSDGGCSQSHDVSYERGEDDVDGSFDSAMKRKALYSFDAGVPPELDKVLEDRLSHIKAESEAVVAELDQRITEEWTGLRGWVDAAVVTVVNRISALECHLQAEMAERSKQLREVVDGAAEGTEHVKQLQAEVDKLVSEARLARGDLGAQAPAALPAAAPLASQLQPQTAPLTQTSPLMQPPPVVRHVGVTQSPRGSLRVPPRTPPPTAPAPGLGGGAHVAWSHGGAASAANLVLPVTLGPTAAVMTALPQGTPRLSLTRGRSVSAVRLRPETSQLRA